jgi:hypothetical protein
MWNEDERQTLLLAKPAIRKPNAVAFDELGWCRLMGGCDLRNLSSHVGYLLNQGKPV